MWCEGLVAAPAPSLQCSLRIHSHEADFVHEPVGVDAALSDCSSVNSEDTLSLETIEFDLYQIKKVN